MGKRLVKRYNEEFRKSSAKLAVESNLSLAKTAEDLDVNTITLHR
jgi:transposase-like protein